MSSRVKIRHLPERGFFRVWEWLDGAMVFGRLGFVSSHAIKREVLIGPYLTIEEAYGAHP